jgi:CheY-like chemotaxis protein
VLQSCVRAVARATKLTRQLMAFGRHQGSAARSIDLRNQLLAMEDLLKSALSRDLSLRFEVVQDLWMVRVDAVLFEMALLNLVFNARDAIHGKGGVWICAENVRVQLRAVPGLPAGDFVRLAVRDNGEGMSTEVRTKAIDPFFTTKPAGKGSGLGLSQVYGFVQQSQGGLTLDSEPGRGTTVTMYLPRTAELPVEFSEEHPASRSPVPSEHLKVLVVEDDVLVRDVVVPALTGCGFTVVTATHGEEALERLDREHDIQVVFSDIVMPGRLNGVELAQEVNRRWPHLPVVLATGYAEHAGDAATPWRTLPKPYDIGAVAAELRTAVRTHRSS